MTTHNAQRDTQQVNNRPKKQPNPAPPQATTSDLLQRAELAPASLTAYDAQLLQRQLGNQATTRLIVQAKMNVGPVDDKYEREADQMAASVMRQLNANPADLNNIQRAPVQNHLQRMPNHGAEGGEVDASVAQQIGSLKGGGQSLPDTTQREMSDAFGADFSSVRIHSDARAAQLNRSLNARAFTTGSDIFFGGGQYNPQSSGGKELLAHELTHMIQ